MMKSRRRRLDRRMIVERERNDRLMENVRVCMDTR